MYLFVKRAEAIVFIAYGYYDKRDVSDNG